MKYLALLLALTTITTTPLSGQLDSAFFAAMEARSVGPAGMSGRVAAIDAVVSNPNIIYVGSATISSGWERVRATHATAQASAMECTRAWTVATPGCTSDSSAQSGSIASCSIP
jgi:hypothetical protein